MIRLASAAAVAVVLSLTAVGSASAVTITPDIVKMIGPIKGAGGAGGGAGSVGDPFLFNQDHVDPRALCLAKGGTPKNQIEADGSIGIRCLMVPN
jgi:hypothetical protein